MPPLSRSPKTASVPTAPMENNYSSAVTTHVLSLLSTGVPPERAMLSPREWRRREQRQQRQQKQKSQPPAKRGFA